jgi:hypothetical protein
MLSGEVAVPVEDVFREFDAKTGALERLDAGPELLVLEHARSRHHCDLVSSF